MRASSARRAHHLPQQRGTGIVAGQRGERHRPGRVEQILPAAGLPAAVGEHLLPPAAAGVGMAFEQQQAQRRRALAVAVGQLGDPAGEGRRVAGGVVDDDEHLLLPAPRRQVLLVDEPLGLVARGKAGLPAGGRRTVAQVEREPRLAAAAAADEHLHRDRARRVEEGLHRGEFGLAADQLGRAPVGRQAGGLATVRHRAGLHTPAPLLLEARQRQVRMAGDDGVAVADDLHDDVAVAGGDVGELGGGHGAACRSARR